MHKTIGFIGCGNMGKAILGGILEANPDRRQHTLVSASTQETLKDISDRFQVETTRSNREVAQRSDYVFLAVKPHLYPQILREIRDELKADALIIGMAAGVTLEKMEDELGKDRKLVKIMPNTPVAVKAGVIAMALGQGIDAVDEENLLALLQGLGTVFPLEEKHMDVITGISGSSPAYVYLFLEAMADAAVKNGLPRKEAYAISAQAVLGAAKMLLETGVHPGILKDMVTSPGGTTIDAVAKLEEEGFRHAVISAVDVCIEKSRKMSQ